MVLDEGPRTTLPSVQPVLGFKRRAVSNERSRAGPPNWTILGQALRDDKVSGFRGQALRDDKVSGFTGQVLRDD